VIFVEARLDAANLDKARLPSAIFADAFLGGAGLAGAISGKPISPRPTRPARRSSAPTRVRRLSNANLEDADFTDAQVFRTRFHWKRVESLGLASSTSSSERRRPAREIGAARGSGGTGSEDLGVG